MSRLTHQMGVSFGVLLLRLMTAGFWGLWSV